jgi:hypothetical protein
MTARIMSHRVAANRGGNGNYFDKTGDFYEEIFTNPPRPLVVFLTANKRFSR